MRKTIYLLLGTTLLAMSSVGARTWTSADGAKTFQGEFKKYDENAGKVTVVRGFKTVTFGIDKLSDADREWLKSQSEVGKAEQKSADAVKSLDDQKIGSKIKVDVLSKVEGDAFVDYALDRAPEYYVVYYSGSW